MDDPATVHRCPDDGGAKAQATENVIFHSDRGSQYASGDFLKLLAKHGMRCSMSRKGRLLRQHPG